MPACGSYSGGTFAFSPQPKGRTGEKGLVERKFGLRGAGGAAISCPMVVLGVLCKGTSCDGDASLRNEKFSLNSRATSEGLCRMSFRCRLDGSTSRTVPDSEAMKRLPLLPNAVFAWYRKDYVVVCKV